MTKDEIIAGVVGREGGYVDNPDDKGGPTRWGVTEKVARAHGYTGHMRDLPRATAVAIFEADYWFGPRFDLAATLAYRAERERHAVPRPGARWPDRPAHYHCPAAVPESTGPGR